MFLERLSTIQGRIDGAIALSLVDSDGIPVESVSSDPALDLEVLAAEMLAQVRLISDQNRELAVGAVQQFSVTTDRISLLISVVAAGYYLLLVLQPEASYGRARFELKRARLLFEGDLE
jgi:predicted regulator of Ras-like GTPase activity (Roadblock/LC7/MglB family)